MNIKRAKQEIKNTIQAYLLKDEFGRYVIPSIRQRPVLLIGAPGIGKTQIMEQIARECGVGLVSYTITHHTRQSAVGLPFIAKKEYGGREYSVTEYTMSGGNSLHRRDQLRVGDPGPHDAAVSAVQDLRQPQNPGRMADCRRRKSPGVQ